MRTLYHFVHSPFSRRTRLALAHKGLDCELRDGRSSPAVLEEARRLAPFRTIPVLVDGGRAMGDSVAIAQWLDLAYPDAPRLWPAGEDAVAALQTAALVDVALNHVVDVGTRYYPLRESAAWAGVVDEMLGRARLALDALAERTASLGRPTVVRSGWSAADMWLYTMVAWFEGMRARAQGNQNITQILTLGITVPSALVDWARSHRERQDVRALG
jgi:glutathione S-transferase